MTSLCLLCSRDQMFSVFSNLLLLVFLHKTDLVCIRNNLTYDKVSLYVVFGLDWRCKKALTVPSLSGEPKLGKLIPIWMRESSEKIIRVCTLVCLYYGFSCSDIIKRARMESIWLFVCIRGNYLISTIRNAPFSVVGLSSCPNRGKYNSKEIILNPSVFRTLMPMVN